MSDQPSSPNNNNAGNGNRPAGNNPNNNRRHNNQRRRPQGPNPNQNPNQNRDANASGGGPRPRPQGQSQGPGPNPPREGGGGNNQRRRHRGNQNRSRNPNGPGAGAGGAQQSHNNPPHGSNIERIYEKYLNLLDQHLIARRKYHDLFYRAEPSQKNKLERNFYNTLHDIREFENKLTPEARELFEKRNNGLKQDNIYTSNHELPLVGENPPPETEWADPHYLQSQKIANYADDKEESVGGADDYLKYKNLI